MEQTGGNWAKARIRLPKKNWYHEPHTMDILDIFRTVPDDGSSKWVFELSTVENTDVIRRYEAQINWNDVVDAAFS